MDTSPDIRRNTGLVGVLCASVHNADVMIRDVPNYLIDVIEYKAWLRFETTSGQIVEYEDSPAGFLQFVDAPNTEGMGATIKMLYDLCEGNQTALKALDRVLQRPVGNPDFGNSSQEPIVYNVHNRTQEKDPLERPSGNSDKAARRRLAKDRPDMMEKVEAGELSPNAAMVEAGFRHVTKTLIIDDMDALARALRRHLDASQLEALARLLTCQRPEEG